MITPELLKPRSIVVIGGSNDIRKPGGKVLYNLINHGYKGSIHVVNPKQDFVQGIASHAQVEDLPQVDMAILAIPAAACPETVESLCKNKETKAFIIFSAGFSEENREGARLEARIKETVDKYGASLIGPNCIGVMNGNYTGVFTTPIPRFEPSGVDLISGSGATALFIIDAAVKMGIPFNSVFSVGNSTQTGVEDVLQYLDQTYEKGKSSPVKLLYIENINNPRRLYKHALSLYNKGARIAAIKAGYSEAGSRAASSHTGAMATPDKAVTALFDKAGIIRCFGRNELLTVASILLKGVPKGNRVGIITHAGGPAVMLTDVLSTRNVEIPPIQGPKAQALLSRLYPGSSVGNPIDFLATGTAAHLGTIIDFVENECPEIDAMVVIFGSPGLNEIFDVYDLLDRKMKVCKKPIYPVFPSEYNVKKEIEAFTRKGRLYFADEVLFGSAFARILNTPLPVEQPDLPPVDKTVIRAIVDRSPDGYLPANDVQALLDSIGIYRVDERIVLTADEAAAAAREIGFPIVMKVVGPIHKSDIGGVRLNIKNELEVRKEFEAMINLRGCTSIMLQPQLSGVELFIGAKRQGNFGHMVLCGIGGVFVEVWQDISSNLCPVSKTEVQRMLEKLRGYKLLEGIRGQEGVNIPLFIDAIRRTAALCIAAPEIFEMDINPLLATEKHVTAVDARIRIVRETAEKHDL